ncbi:MAG: MarR family transcriptional regulator [Anaerolineae bacterium]|nr:MarR family transcriptional regulator [Anaerolineae bacterium]
MNSELPRKSETEDLAVRFLRVLDEAFRHVGVYKTSKAQNMFSALNLNQLRALVLLQREPGMAQKDLATQLEVTPAAISTAVKYLEKLSLIERRPDDEDGRTMRLYLSSKAESILEHHRTFRSKSVAELLSALPLSEQHIIVEALERALAAKAADFAKQVCD